MSLNNHKTGNDELGSGICWWISNENHEMNACQSWHFAQNRFIQCHRQVQVRRKGYETVQPCVTRPTLPRSLLRGNNPINQSDGPTPTSLSVVTLQPLGYATLQPSRIKISKFCKFLYWAIQILQVFILGQHNIKIYHGHWQQQLRRQQLRRMSDLRYVWWGQAKDLFRKEARHHQIWTEPFTISGILKRFRHRNTIQLSMCPV